MIDNNLIMIIFLCKYFPYNYYVPQLEVRNLDRCFLNIKMIYNNQITIKILFKQLEVLFHITFPHNSNFLVRLSVCVVCAVRVCVECGVNLLFIIYTHYSKSWVSQNFIVRLCLVFVLCVICVSLCLSRCCVGSNVSHEKKLFSYILSLVNLDFLFSYRISLIGTQVLSSMSSDLPYFPAIMFGEQYPFRMFFENIRPQR